MYDVSDRIRYIRDHRLHETELPEPESRGPVNDWRYVAWGFAAIILGFAFAYGLALIVGGG